MNNGLVLSESLIRNLAEDAGKEIIILGSGALARDFQRKLRLLGLKAPFLVGDRDDPGGGVRHYKSLLELKKPLGCKFVLCFGADEFETYAAACPVMYKALGPATKNHPNVIHFSTVETVRSHAGRQVTDTLVQGGIERGGVPYAVFGGAQDEPSFKLHMIGHCMISGVFVHASRSVPEILYEKLKRAGFNAAVYSWGQPSYTPSNSLALMLRDIMRHKPDFLVQVSSSAAYNPVKKVRKNPLSVREDYDVVPFVLKLQLEYAGERSNGIEFDIDYPALFGAQSRMFHAMAKWAGFGFMHALSPSIDVMREAQSLKLLGLSKGHLKRARERKDALLAAPGAERVRDYTGIFDDVPDIYEIYAERMHLTEKGNEIFAEKLFGDLIAQLPPKSSGGMSRP